MFEFNNEITNNNLNQLNQTSGNSEISKVKQMIDFSKYPNLERLNEEDLQNLVLDSSGKLLPEEALKAANKAAGEQNIDSVKKNDDEDAEEMKKLGLYNLYMTGKISKSGKEWLDESIHDKDGKLKDEAELKALDEKILTETNAQFMENVNNRKDESLAENLGSAYEKNQEVEDEVNAVKKELKELVGDEEFEKIEQQEKEAKESVGGFKKDEDARDLSTKETRQEFVKNLDSYNETADDKKKIDRDNDDIDTISEKLFDLENQKTALGQLKETVEKTKEAKAQQEKIKSQSANAAGATPAPANAENMNADKLKEYVNTNPEQKAKTGLYVNNAPLTQQIGQEVKENDQVVNINNDKYFNKINDEKMKQIFEEQKKLKFENGEGNINDPMALLSDMEGGPKNLKDLNEKLQDMQKGNTDLSAGPLGIGDKEKKFNPYKEIMSDESGAFNTNSSSSLQFSKTNKTDEVADDIDVQMGEETDAFDAKISQEKQNLQYMESDAQVAQKVQETFAGVHENAHLAKVDGQKWIDALNAQDKAAQDIQKITAQNQQTQATNTKTNADNENQKNSEAVIDFANAAAAAAIPGGQATAAMWAGFATQALKMAMQFGAEKNRSSSYENDLGRQQEAARQQQAQINAINSEVAQKQAKADEETLKGLNNIAQLYNQQSATQLQNISYQAKRVDNIEQTKEDRLAKLNADKELLAKKKSTIEDKEVKENKENTAVKTGNEEDNKETKANEKGVFEFKESEEKSDDMKTQFANKLMDDGKTVEKQGQEAILASGIAPKLNMNNVAVENEESEDDDIANIQFQAYSKENRITKEILEVEESKEADLGEKQAKNPALRRASRFAKTADKINNVDGTAGKGFTA